MLIAQKFDNMHAIGIKFGGFFMPRRGKTPCFFSALGAPDRRARTDFNTRMRGKML